MVFAVIRPVYFILYPVGRTLNSDVNFFQNFVIIVDEIKNSVVLWTEKSEKNLINNLKLFTDQLELRVYL